MERIINRLSELKKGIDEAKTNIAKIEGREQETLKRLMSDFNLATEEEASAELKELSKQKEELENGIREDFKLLESEYDW